MVSARLALPCSTASRNVIASVKLQYRLAFFRDFLVAAFLFCLFKFFHFYVLSSNFQLLLNKWYHFQFKSVAVCFFQVWEGSFHKFFKILNIFSSRTIFSKKFRSKFIIFSQFIKILPGQFFKNIFFQNLSVSLNFSPNFILFQIPLLPSKI